MHQHELIRIIKCNIPDNFFVFKKKCLAIGRFIFITDEIDPILLNTELIRASQYTEMTFIGFFLEYAKEFIINVMHGQSIQKANQNISFKLEAITHAADMAYLDHRIPYAWKNYIEH